MFENGRVLEIVRKIVKTGIILYHFSLPLILKDGKMIQLEIVRTIDLGIVIGERILQEGKTFGSSYF